MYIIKCFKILFCFVFCSVSAVCTPCLKFDSSLKKPDSSHKSESRVRVPHCDHQVAPYTGWRGTSQPLWHWNC